MGQRGLPTLLILTLISLTACGTQATPPTPDPPTVPQSPPATLTGNWLLTGSRVPSVPPNLSGFLYAQANVLTGEMSFHAQCSTSTSTFGIGGGDFPIDGTIDDKGAFQAANEVVGTDATGTISLKLTGNSPLAATPSVWAGSYSLAFTPGSLQPQPNCSIAQNGSFTATPIASLTGTYLGVPANPSLAQQTFGAEATVSVQIIQGAPIPVTRASQTRYRIPLTANLAIGNSPCPLVASTDTSAIPSFLSGDSFNLTFATGTPYGFISGTLNDVSANTFSGDLTSLAVAAGCPGIALYTFTRK